MCSFYRKFIKDFSEIARPLTNLTKSNVLWKWTTAEQQAFDRLKSFLTHAPILAQPQEHGKYELSTDASQTSLGAVLSQEQDGIQKPIAFASRMLTDTETRYSTTEQEALAVVWAVQKFWPYLWSRHFILKTDHQALRAIRTGTNINSKLTRYPLLLQNFDFEIKYVPGPLNRVADALSRIHEDESFEELRQPEELPFQSAERQEPVDTNNRNSLISPSSNSLCGTQIASTLQDKKRANRDPFNQLILPDSLQSPTTGQCFMLTENSATTTAASMPDNSDPPSLTLAQQQETDSEIGPLYKYLKYSTVSPPLTQAGLQKRTRGFAMRGDVLVQEQRGIIRTVVPQVLRSHILHRCHSDMSAGYFGYVRTLKKVQQLYVQKDIKTFVRCCETCQMFKHDQRRSPGLMAERKVPSVWEICNSDICGPHPTSTKGNSYLVVFQDEYSKAVELAPIKRANSVSIARSFVELVIARHGCPRYLKSDNGKAYCSNILKQVCKILGVEQCHILPYRPQGNPSERSIKDISRIIASYTAGRHDKWDNNICLISLAINSAYQFSTKISPYELLYGRQIRLPAISDDHLHSDSDWIPHDQYVAELRDIMRHIVPRVVDNIKAASIRQKRTYDAHRRPDTFQEGDFVCCASHYLSDASKGFSSKLAPKRTGPFKIVDKLSDILYKIQDVRTGDEKNAHIDQLQTYFRDGHPLPDEEAPCMNEVNDPTPQTLAPATDQVARNRGNTLDAPGAILNETPDSDDEDLVCGFYPCPFPEAIEWLFCDLCDRPFHTQCIGVDLAEAEDMDFVCPNCRSTASGAVNK